MTMKKVISVPNWPKMDQLAWAAAFDGTDPFESGAGVHLAPHSRKTIASGYGRWIGFLMANEPQSLEMRPDLRVSHKRVRQFVACLQQQVTPAGAHNYVKHTYDAVRIMYPKADWAWLKTIAWRLARGVRPFRRSLDVVHSGRLYDLGLELMKRAEASRACLHSAVLFRDGLMIAMLAVIPVRRRNASNNATGVNLIAHQNGYDLTFRADETKMKRSLEYEIPADLHPYLTRYVQHYRPRFPGAAETNALWLSAKGGALTSQGFYDQICARTRTAFGRRINSHLFRHCAVTTIAIEAPSEIGRAGDLLGDSSIEVRERHYNLSRAIEVSRLYNSVVQDILSGAEKPAPTGDDRCVP